MKRMVVIFLFLLPLFSIAQEYSEVVEVPGKNASKLYSSAKAWFAMNFKSANDVIQMDDPDNGKLIGKGVTRIKDFYRTGGIASLDVAKDYDLEFAVSISVKDGKYKAEISNINVKVVSRIDGDPVVTPTMTLKQLMDQREYFKNGSDPEWLINYQQKLGVKLNKQTSKLAADMNHSYYLMIISADEKMKDLLASLQERMKKNEDNW